MCGLDPRIHLFKTMDCRVIGERSDAALRTAMPGNDVSVKTRNALADLFCRDYSPVKPALT
jgi:hypothetical protein